MVVGAIPMLLMEFAIGQYTGQGVVTCWNIVPIFKGISICLLLLVNKIFVIESALYKRVGLW